MRTNVIIDDKLMRAAQKATGTKTKKATIEAGLNLLVKLKQQEKVRALRGKLHWEGDLEQMRKNKDDSC